MSVEPMSDEDIAYHVEQHNGLSHEGTLRIKARLDALQAVVDQLEWSSTRIDGTGCRMGYADRDGIQRAACPVCHGYKPNHEPGCELAALKEQNHED